MSSKTQSSVDKWALFRFSIVGGLLAKPPATGELRKELKKLSRQGYMDPVRNRLTFFHFSTIESWYYKAKNAEDPIAALSRKVRSDIDKSTVLNTELITLLGKQYKSYPSWSYQLHTDNLAAEIEEPDDPDNPPPSYATVRRAMVKRGWVKKRLRKKKETFGEQAAAQRLEDYEVRSYEAEYAHGLWHLDFHECSRRVAEVNGEWQTPKALCILDDHSRLCCHIQWYFNETAEVLFHGLSQAFYKRGLPRSLMTDNGSAMIAHETCNGLGKLAISHEKTLPYSPYQNGKQESFWGNLEGRLLALLKQVNPLTLDYLNHVTQAWVEMEYNKKKHDEIGMSPVQRMLESKDMSRPVPNEKEMQFAFTVCESRKQRQSDGTISINGVRFEVPSRFNHMRRLHVCFNGWDKSIAWLVDKRTGAMLATIYPQDKLKNASGKRRLKALPEETKLPDETLSNSEPALLRKILAEYAETGLPAAYLPK
ncbi:MAG: transposase [Desulfamplus sp.]|nr:transposase [Desulfamplus sp.]